MSAILDAALQYAASGLSIIPINPAYDAERERFSKKALINWKGFQGRRASADEIRAWWQQYPTAMIGIVTGKISDLFAIDCDTQEGFEAIQSLLPETMLVPTAKTPRGGWHLWFRYPQEKGLTIKAGAITGVDYRGEGGYIIASPSVNAHGGRYQWLQGLAYNEVAVPSLDSNIILILKGGNNNNTPQKTTKTTSDHTDNIWGNGVRDENLFHLALNLAKQGDDKNFIFQTLTAIMKSWGEEDHKWALAKIDSAFKRLETKERNIAEEVREFVLTTTGHFLTTECHNRLQMTTRDHKKTVTMALLRLQERGIIEKYGNRNGSWRLVESQADIINVIDADIVPYPIRLPLQIEDEVIIHKSNVIIIAGESNAGKTAFCLNVAKMNQDLHPINYLSNEMQDGTELKIRLQEFNIPMDFWKRTVFRFRLDNFPDVIQPDALNIIDYLDEGEEGEAYKMAYRIRKIAAKLKNGIAVIALQKNSQKEWGYGGEGTLNTARLYMTISRTGVLKIVKGKIWANKIRNPNGLFCNFKLAAGCKFYKEGDWKK